MGIREQPKERATAMRSFTKNKSGTIYAWLVVLLLTFTYAVVWFTAGWAALELADTVEETFTLGSQGTNIVGMIKMVFAWHPVIVIIGLLLYGFVSSQRRDVRYDY